MSLSIFSSINQLTAGYQLMQLGAYLYQNKYPKESYNTNQLALYFMATNVLVLAWSGYQQNPLIKKQIICLSILGGYLSGSLPLAGRLYKERDFQSLGKNTIEGDSFELAATISCEIQYQELIPVHQQLMRAVHVAQLIQVLGVLYLNKTSPYHWMQLVGLLGTLSYSYKTKWVEISYQHPLPLSFQCEDEEFNPSSLGLVDRKTYTSTLENPTFSWRIALYPTLFDFSSEPCSVCNDSAANAYYCTNRHRYCHHCLIHSHIQTINGFATKLLTGEYKIEPTFPFCNPDRFSPKTLYKTIYKLVGVSRDDSFPSCPTCRDVPPETTIHLKEGKVDCSFPPHIWESKRFWGIILSTYQIAKVALTALSFSNAKFISSFYWVHHLAIIPEAVFLLGIEPFLNDERLTEFSIKRFYLFLGMFLLICWALSKKAPLPTDQIKKILSQSDLKNLDIIKGSNYHPFLSYYLTSSVYLFFLATQSKLRKTPLFISIALVNAIAVYRLSDISSISFKRTYHHNLPSSVKSATVEFSILYPQKHLPTISHDKFIKAVHEYTGRFFSGSEWGKKYWNGFKVDRSLRFDIKIIQNPFILEGIDLSDYIHAVSGTAVSPTTYNKIWRKSVAELMFKTL